MDFNADKRQVLLKFQTAGICEDCQEKFFGYNNYTNLFAFFRKGLEHIRMGILDEQYYSIFKPKPVKVIFKRMPSNRRGYVIEFEGIGNIDLNHKKMAIYINLLRNGGKGGWHNASLYRDYYFLDGIYRRLRGITEDDKIDIRASTFLNLCKIKKVEGGYIEINNNNDLYSEICTINKSLKGLLGVFGLEKFYEIEYATDSGYKIASNEFEFIDETGIINTLEGIYKESEINILRLDPDKDEKVQKQDE